MKTYKMKKELALKAIVLVFLLGMGYLSSAQLPPPGGGGGSGGTPTVSISGPSSATVNQNKTYTVSASGGTHSYSSYSVSGGYITYSSKTTVRVTWNSVGSSRWIKVTAGVGSATKTATKYVTVGSSCSISTYSVTGGGSFCSGGSGKYVGLSDSQSGVSYRLYRNGSYVKAVSGTNVAISFGNQTVSGTYTVTAYKSGCSIKIMSGSKTVTANPLPGLASGSNKSRCGTGAVTLTASPGSNGNTIRWYSASSGGSLLRTGTSYTTPSLSSSKTYYAASYNSSTGCLDTHRRAITAVINAVPGTPSTPSITYNCGNTKLTRGNPPGGITWYWQGTNSNGTSTSNSASTYTTSSSGTYYIRARNNSSGCWSGSRSRSVSINTVPGTPSTPSITYNCGSTELTRSNPSSGITWYWQGTNSNGTSTSNSASTYTTSSAGTYYIRARNNTSGCWSGSRSKSVTINSIPAIPASPSVTNNCGSTTLTRSSAPGGITWYWQGTNSSGTSTTGAALDASYSTTAPGTYYIRSKNNSSDCWGSSRATTVTINPVPAVASGSDERICGAGSATLIASPGTNGNTIQWYDDLTSGTLLYTGTSFTTPTISSNTTYYAETYNSSTSCKASTRTAIVAIVDPIPAVATGSDNSICGPGTVILSASPGTNGNTIRWFNSLSGGTLLHMGTSYTTPNISVSTTYYAETFNTTTGCYASSRKAIDAIIDPIPDLPTGVDVARCGPGSLTLTASTGANGNGVRWYNESGTLLHAGTTYTTPSISESTTYYAASFNSTTDCEGTSKAMQAIINSFPSTYIVTGGGNYCSGGTGVEMSLSGSQSGLSYQLHREGLVVGSPVSGNGGPISFGNQIEEGAYTVIASSANCSSTMTDSVVVAIDQLPTMFDVSGGGSFCVGDSGLDVQLSSSQVNVNYQLKINGTELGTPVGGTGGVLSFGLQSQVGDYTVQASNLSTGCVSDMNGSASVQTNSLPVTYDLTGGGSYCNGNVGVPVGLSLSETGVSYQLLLDGLSTGSPLDGTGAAIDFGNQTGEGVYTIEATNTTTLCVNAMNNSKVISINTLPVAYEVTGGGAYCANESGVEIGLSSSETAVSYQLIKGGVNFGIAVDGTGAAISFGFITEDGNYEVEAISAGSCLNSMNGNASVSILPSPGVAQITDVTYSLDVITLTRAIPPVGETWYWQNSAFGEDESNFEVTHDVQAAGDYYLRSKKDNGCWGDAVSVSIDAAEPTTITVSALSSESLHLTWSAVAGSEGYKVHRSGTSDGPFEEIGTTTELEYSDDYLATGTTYFYRIQSMVSGQISTAVQVLSATTPTDFNGDQSINQTGLYNGNISAIRWKNASDEAEQVFTYSYDGLNRLKSAKYAEHDGASFNTHSGHFSVPTINYDLNGNIQTLTRQGINEASNADIIDELTYTYGTAGNQLQDVSDARSEAGFSDGNTNGVDYAYDENGNMVQDLNKAIVDIDYNYLNLPEKVTFENGDYITYLYDAAGIKLSQTVVEDGNPVKTTDYVGEFIYEDLHDGNGSQLQLVQHAEGRLTPLLGGAGGGFDYQYHLKDHLGNTRVTFSTTPENYEMVAEMENASEADNFSNYVATPDGLAAHSGTHVFRNSNNIGSELGLNTFLSVNKGDTIKASAYAYYSDAGGSYNLATGVIEGALFGAFNTNYVGEGASAAQSNFDDAFGMGTSLGGRAASSDAPRGFVNYIFFDKDMNYVTAGFKQISDASNGTSVQVVADDFIADSEGFIFVYLSNETEGAEVVVSWDDFTIYHGKTNVVQTDDYYPFGLAFNSYSRTASTVNNFKFASNECLSETGWIDFYNRMYQPDLGRFISNDPLATYKPSWTPYRYAFNNPIRFIDPNGLLEVDEIVDIFNNAPDGASSYDGDGNCTCGCPGKPPCDKKALQGVPVVAGLSKQTVKEGAKQGVKGVLGSFFAAILATITPANGFESNGSDIETREQNEFNDLAYKESQGSLTDEQKRRLQFLREKYSRGNSGSNGLKLRSVNDFELTHGEDLITRSSSYQDIKNLSNEDLIDSIISPNDGNGVVVNKRTGKVINGNTRLYELRRRGLNIIVPHTVRDPGNTDYFYDLE